MNASIWGTIGRRRDHGAGIANRWNVYATYLNDKKLIQIYNEATHERHGHDAAA